MNRPTLHEPQANGTRFRCRARLQSDGGMERCTRLRNHSGWHSYIAQYDPKKNWKPKVIVKWANGGNGR